MNGDAGMTFIEQDTVDGHELANNLVEPTLMSRHSLRIYLNGHSVSADRISVLRYRRLWFLASDK